jgi:capsular polysaccharide transport system permease protein
MLKQKRLSWSFVLIVIIPSVFSIVYFGLIASDRYVSTSSFVVRSPQKTSSVGGLSAFLQSSGFARSQDDSYVVNDYMMSRDAVAKLQKDLDLKQVYTQSYIDFLSKFNTLGLDDSMENLYKYYQNRVKVTLESTSSISTLEVRAYSAKEAYEINNNLLNMAESLVNSLNARGRQDLIRTSNLEVAVAQQRVEDISAKVVNFRTKNQIFDLEKHAPIELQLISKLQDQLILVQTQIAQIQLVTPENPQISVLKEREKNLDSQIARIRAQMLGKTDASYNSKSTEYERLMIEKEVAVKQLAGAMATLEQNKNEAERKQLYLERIAQPNISDAATEPKRFKNIVATVLISLILWGIFTLLAAGVREHQG